MASPTLPSTTPSLALIPTMLVVCKQNVAPFFLSLPSAFWQALKTLLYKHSPYVFGAYAAGGTKWVPVIVREIIKCWFSHSQLTVQSGP